MDKYEHKDPASSGANDGYIWIDPEIGYVPDTTDYSRISYDPDTDPDWREPTPKSKSKAPRRQAFRLMTGDEIDALPDPEWLIEGILPADSLTVLYGPPGSKKSFLALDWGSCLATGLDWCGHPVKQGDVVYIAAEGASGLPKRRAAWRLARKRDPKALLFQLRPVDISDPATVCDFIAAIRTKRSNPRLIIIDTLARNFVGDENSAKDMNAFVAGCDALRAAFPGCAVVVVHHTGWKKGHERGSSVLRGAADCEIEVRGKSDERTGYFDCVKSKDAEPFKRIFLEVAPTGPSIVLEYSAVGPIPSEPAAKAARPNASDAAILKALKASPDGATYGQLSAKSGVKERTLTRRLEVLKDAKKVAKDEATGIYKLTDMSGQLSVNSAT